MWRDCKEKKRKKEKSEEYVYVYCLPDWGGIGVKKFVCLFVCLYVCMAGTRVLDIRNLAFGLLKTA